MNPMRNLQILLFLFVFSPAVSAQYSDSDAINTSALADSPGWRALGHYHRDLTGWRSDIDDDGFFLAENGAVDPHRELVATLAAFTDPERRREMACRYPSRFAWLRGQSRALAEQAAPRCPAFERWLDEMKPAGASLIFPAAYINSPSSMFGHTFLRIDGVAQNERTRLLAYSIGYGAEVARDENGFLYAWNGLTGGYQGFLNGAAYYDKVIEYNDLEARDIWEYRLELDPDELAQLMRHIWELQQVNFDYYFIDENCSYRLLSLLDVARPGMDVAAKFASHTIPADTVRALQSHGLIGAKVYRPAALTQLRFSLGEMDTPQQELALALATGSLAPGDRPEALDDAGYARTLDVAYDVLRYRVQKKLEADATGASGRSLRLLSARSKLPAASMTPPPSPEPPEAGHRSARFDLGLAQREQETTLLLAVRPAFHDLLDNPAGYVAGAAINFFSLQAALDTETGRLQLDRFQLLDITAIPARNRFLKPISWRVNAGWERAEERRDDPMRFRMMGSWGMTWALDGGHRVSLFANGRGQSAVAMNRELELGAGGSLLWSRDLGAERRLLVRLDRWEHEGRSDSDGAEIALGINVPVIDRDHALRLTLAHTRYRYQNDTRAELRWLSYF